MFPKLKTFLSSSTPIKDVVEQPTNIVDGGLVEVRTIHKTVDLCSPEACKNIIPQSEFTLEKQLKSGIPLQQIDTTHFLDDTDIAVVSEKANSLYSSNEEKFNEIINSLNPSNDEN